VSAGAEPGADSTETERIRAAYRERDRRPARHAAIAEAYRLVSIERLALMEREITEAVGAAPRLLDVGCGTGTDLASWLERGWPPDRLAGVDLVEDRIAVARARCPGVDLRVTSGAQLPFESGAFDVATAGTVFSSILDPSVRRQLFAEMRRVVRNGGAVLVYDFVVRKPGNHDVVAMSAQRMADLGEPPEASIAMTPLIQVVAVASLLGRRAAALAMRTMPRTHRLWRWRI
jgi:ubiquinone/menaquinone biosynthesis C-methylase UbiE